MKLLTLAVCLMGLTIMAVSAIPPYEGVSLVQRQQEAAAAEAQDKQFQEQIEKLREEEERRRVAESLRQRFRVDAQQPRQGEQIVMLRPGVSERVLDASDAYGPHHTRSHKLNRAILPLILGQVPQPPPNQQQDREPIESTTPETSENEANSNQNAETAEKPIQSTAISSKTVTLVKAIKRVGDSAVTYASRITTLRTSFINVFKRLGYDNSNQQQEAADEPTNKVESAQEEPSSKMVKIVSYQVKSAQAIIRKQNVNNQ